MGNLFANRGLLLTAWFVVMAFLGGALTLAFLQPPPPPSAEPVVIAVDLSPLPEEMAEMPAGGAGQMAEGPEGQDPHGMVPPEEAPTEAPEAVGEAAGEAAGQETHGMAPAPEGHAPEGHTEEAVAPEPPAPETTPEAAPETAPEAAAEPAAPASSVTAALPEPEPEAAAEEHPAQEHAAQEAAAQEQAAEDHAAAEAEMPPAASEGHAAEAPATEGHGEPSPAKQDHAAADHPAEGHAAEGQAAEGQAVEGHGADGEQLVHIPVIPPAPEQLPYWERYRQPFNMDDKRPRIAVVLSGLGLSDSATEAAINKLPAAVTLSFSPYARDLERWIALARSRGHEVMIDLPMEPATFPNEDPGPQALLTGLSAEDNLDRLDWVLSRGSAYVGVAGSMGSRFTASRSAMEPILRDVKNRGLIFLDRRTTENSVVPELAREIGLPRAINNRSVDERQASRVAIDARLAQIERIALTEGYAVAMAQPYPVTLERLADWATELTARGYVIAPITALANQQTLP